MPGDETIIADSTGKRIATAKRLTAASINREIRASERSVVEIDVINSDDALLAWMLFALYARNTIFSMYGKSLNGHR